MNLAVCGATGRQVLDQGSRRGHLVTACDTRCCACTGAAARANLLVKEKNL